ncbi:hypothetical protein FIBSPDRAFT_927033 [Athelia psychrophila]|uniref:Fungal-type protein kinase domain-containing protein n=1 Tax=Athelia psychrophila TaxID=1759441 RepID=A0A166SAT6_9AGAM|nr:hypothetical protein FIBSPDRAFT_927033 [Fibularhizoctonia sp. CBS 109695]
MSKSNSLDNPTPHKASGHSGVPAFNLSAVRAAVAAEMANTWVAGGADYLYAILGSEPSLHCVEEFIIKSPLYENKRWTHIPTTAKLENEVCEPATAIVNAVLDHFNRAPARRGVDSHSADIMHGYRDEKPHLPNIIILMDGKMVDPDTPADDAAASSKETASGLPLEHAVPDSRDAESKTEEGSDDAYLPTGKQHSPFAKPLYRNMASFVETKQNIERSINDFRPEIATYAREIFIQQQNRYHVFGILLTEKTAEALGFDNSIYWSSGKRYLKVGDTNYIIVQGRPVFLSRSIRGKCTTCWDVKIPGSEKHLFIKDYWKAEKRPYESDYLLDTKGLLGVGQMIDYVKKKSSIIAQRKVVLNAFLSDDMSASDRVIGDRQLCRVVMENCGRPIDHFPDPKQLLRAMHDAINGHRGLFQKYILHRDVSMMNVLVCPTDSPGLFRGVIIDLDLAIRLRRNETLPKCDHRTGTRFYQSIHVLQAEGQHDHLDDLESFFYLFCMLCFGYSGPGHAIVPTPSVFLGWDQEHPMQAAFAKLYFTDLNPKDVKLLYQYDLKFKLISCDLEWKWSMDVAFHRPRSAQSSPAHKSTTTGSNGHSGSLNQSKLKLKNVTSNFRVTVTRNRLSSEDLGTLSLVASAHVKTVFSAVFARLLAFILGHFLAKGAKVRGQRDAARAGQKGDAPVVIDEAFMAVADDEYTEFLGIIGEAIDELEQAEPESSGAPDHLGVDLPDSIGYRPRSFAPVPEKPVASGSGSKRMHESEQNDEPPGKRCRSSK